MEDLSVDGPGSPVSLKKFVNANPDVKPLTLLVDGSGLGIAKDHEDFIYITPEECSKQAIYYKNEKFTGGIPAYLFRYLSQFFRQEHTFETDLEVVEYFRMGILTEEHEQVKFIRSLIKYCDINAEAAQAIGLIQLVGGYCSMAKKHNTGIRLYIERPETALHPSRQSEVASFLVKIMKEYGFEEDTIKEGE